MHHVNDIPQPQAFPKAQTPRKVQKESRKKREVCRYVPGVCHKTHARPTELVTMIGTEEPIISEPKHTMKPAEPPGL